jgi:hypothetical protein
LDMVAVWWRTKPQHPRMRFWTQACLHYLDVWKRTLKIRDVSH